MPNLTVKNIGETLALFADQAGILLTNEEKRKFLLRVIEISGLQALGLYPVTTPRVNLEEKKSGNEELDPYSYESVKSYWNQGHDKLCKNPECGGRLVSCPFPMFPGLRS